jgi:ankyrin repeat protein
MNASLSDACRTGNISAVNTLILSKCDVNQVLGERRETSLMIAARACHEDVTRLLIASNASIYAQNSSGQSVLFYLAGETGVSILQLLLGEGVSAVFEQQDCSGNTALIHKIEDFEEVVSIALLRAGAKPFIEKCTLITASTLPTQPVLVQALLEAATPDQLDLMCPAGETALRRAVLAMCPVTVRLLLGARASLHVARDQWPLLMEASRFHESVDVAALLLSAGADVCARGPDGETALLCACEAEFECEGPHGPASMVRLLLDAGADPFAVAAGGRTVVMAAATQPGETLLVVLESITHGISRR